MVVELVAGDEVVGVRRPRPVGGARVVHERLSQRCGSRSSSRCTSVPLPDATGPGDDEDHGAASKRATSDGPVDVDQRQRRLVDAERRPGAPPRRCRPCPSPGSDLDRSHHVDPADEVVGARPGSSAPSRSTRRRDRSDVDERSSARPSGLARPSRAQRLDPSSDSRPLSPTTAAAIAAAAATGSAAWVTARPITSRSAPLAAASCGVADRAWSWLGSPAQPDAGHDPTEPRRQLAGRLQVGGGEDRAHRSRPRPRPGPGSARCGAGRESSLVSTVTASAIGDVEPGLLGAVGEALDAGRQHVDAAVRVQRQVVDPERARAPRRRG